MKTDETNNSTISSKTAIVVIHGMGNQYPMETITDFVENLFDKEIYSSPERISGSFDHRKLIGFHEGKQYDCYEYYWAHLIKEPTASDTIFWLYNLIWKKEPSERLNEYLSIIRKISIGLPIFLCICFFFIIGCFPIFLALVLFGIT